jgi:hypothetical protein
MARRGRHWLVPTVLLLLLVSATSHAARRPHHARPARAGRVQVQRAPRSEEERALLAIQLDGERRVKALLNASRGWTDKAMLNARARRIEEMRRDTRRRQLEVRAAFARRRGDHAEAAAIQKELRDPRGNRRRA